MNTYTDARLLDTSAAVESLPSLPLKSFVAPTVAPDFGKTCPKEAIDVTFDDPTDDIKKRKNPANPLGIAGFSSIGPAGFEPTTSTTPKYCKPMPKCLIFPEKTLVFVSGTHSLSCI